MPKQQKVGPFSVPEGVERLDVLRGLTRLADLLGCTGRGAAPSVSALIVQLGLIAYQPGGAAQLAEALEDILGHQKTSDSL